MGAWSFYSLADCGGRRGQLLKKTGRDRQTPSPAVPPQDGRTAPLRTLGIGEPPLFLGASVLFALREAVKAARERVAVDAQAIGVVQLDSQATAERLRVAVGDWIVQWAKVEAQEGEKGFFVEATA